MKRILMLVLAGTLLLSACGAIGTEGTDIEAHDYWARAALKDGNGAAYMILHNHSTEDDELVGVSADVATAAEIHLSQMKADGTMEMIQQESIALPVDADVELKPGSYHVMLIGLKQDLKAGDEITLTLHFKNHEDITLTIPVLEAENMGGSGMDGHMP
jgi:hypothetical protein